MSQIQSMVEKCCTFEFVPLALNKEIILEDFQTVISSNPGFFQMYVGASHTNQLFITLNPFACHVCHTCLF